jgi:flavorubredoxin
LVIGDSKAVLVDTGVAFHHDLVAEQLREVVPNLPLHIFLTRSELECIGNLTALSQIVDIVSIYTGGNSNPFDAFDSVGSLGPKRRVPIERVAPGAWIDLGGPVQLEVMQPSLRILATYWAYLPAFRTLFTSDSFGHTMNALESGNRVVDSIGLDRAAAREIFLAKFAWLTTADTTLLVEDLRRLFGEREVEIIAPTHGLVLRGGMVVQEHYQFLAGVLSEFIPARVQGG